MRRDPKRRKTTRDRSPKSTKKRNWLRERIANSVGEVFEQLVAAILIALAISALALASGAKGMEFKLGDLVIKATNQAAHP